MQHWVITRERLCRHTSQWFIPFRGLKEGIHLALPRLAKRRIIASPSRGFALGLICTFLNRLWSRAHFTRTCQRETKVNIPSTWYGCLNPKDIEYTCISLRYALARFWRMIAEVERGIICYVTLYGFFYYDNMARTALLLQLLSG